MINFKLLPLALLFLNYSAFAQQPPNAGGQIQQIPPAPVPQKAAPKIKIEQGTPPALPGADTVKIVVKNLRITGEQIYSESELLALTGFKPGSEMTVSNLRLMASGIADYYHQHGYFAAQAYLPAQDINDGTVTITVIEGRYGKVILQNHTNLSDRVANGILAGLNSGDLIASGPLETRLLLLSDIPGVKVKSTLVPGATLGTSDLIVDISPGKRISGEVDVDNAGNRYTGEYRLGATVNVNNPTGNGDVASLRVLTTGQGLNYGRASYQMLVGKGTVGVAYSHLDYKLGREFSSLRAHGTADIASVYGSYPLLRTRNSNLNAHLGFDAKKFRDVVDSTSSVTDKKVHSLTASLVGDSRDNFGGGGANVYSLGWTTGILDIQTPAVRDLDALTAQTNGHYDKLAFSAARLQNVTRLVSLYGSIRGQLASKNLDTSEKMELGGMYGVRAYPEGEAYADEGYLATLEARLLLPKYSEQMPGQMHLIAFVDTGSVTINKKPWTAGTNSRTLSAAGVGFDWTAPENFLFRVYYARKLGNEMATSAPDVSGRYWFQAVKYF